MKKIILSILISIGCSLQSNAQVSIDELQNMDPQQKAAYFTDSLEIMLALSNDQYTKVHSIILEGFNKAMPVMKDAGSKFSRGRQLKNIFDEQEKQLKTVLSSNQQVIYEKNKKSVIAYYKKQYKEQKVMLDAGGRK